MKLKILSLRTRIFLAMMLLVLLASVLISAVAIVQYKEQSSEYHKGRLKRKENSIQKDLKTFLNGKYHSWEIKTENIPLIFKEEIYAIANIHRLQINIYDLEGGLLMSSKRAINKDLADQCLEPAVLNGIFNTANHKYLDVHKENGQTYQSSYTFISNKNSKPIAILNLPYLENNDFLSKELQEFLKRIGFAFILVLLSAIGIAFLLSKYITKSLKSVSDKINSTRLEKRNEKIDVDGTSEEISILVNSYNSMIDDLEESAVQLAKSEREQAWREMAKQVAHEIKNPLTPMKLSIQYLEKAIKVPDADPHHLVNRISKTLIEQIENLSQIANEFSNFGTLPKGNNEKIILNEVVEVIHDLFRKRDDMDIHLEVPIDDIIVFADRSHLVRVLNNLVKNAMQAIPEEKRGKINLRLFKEQKNAIIKVSDNGSGIPDEMKEKIFTPNFTTKNSGTGLGLAISLNLLDTFNASLHFETEVGIGSDFYITIPLMRLEEDIEQSIAKRTENRVYL